MSHAFTVLLFTFGLFLGMLLFLEIGRRIAVRRMREDTGAVGEGVGAVDGAVFAQIHGDASTLTVLGPDGQPLPPEQRVALCQLLGMFDQVSRLLHCLLVPVNALFALVPQA